jgi:hypothetical protein
MSNKRGKLPSILYEEAIGIAHHQAFKALRRDSSATCIELEAALDLVDEAASPEADLLRQTAHEEPAMTDFSERKAYYEYCD